VGGALARAGADVLLLLRADTLGRHPTRLRVESVVLGDFEVDVATASTLDREIDVLWVTVKAPALPAAVELAPPERLADALVVPLMNGIDHVSVLRERYARVLPAAIGVETERVEPGVIRHHRGARVVLAPGPGGDDVAEELRSSGLEVERARDEPTLLWEKLAFLAPLALTTTAAREPVGVVRSDSHWHSRLLRCHDETLAVAHAEGATLDAPSIRRLFDLVGGDMRSSMQRDFDAGRPLELDAVAGPVLRGGRCHRIATPATEQLVSLVDARLAERRTLSRA
jgi:2-dehydropantoate 2-reductase